MSSAAVEQLTRAERILAAVQTAEEATDVIALADYAADLARRVELGTASVNRALIIKAKAMRKLADIVDEGQAKGEIATQGRPEKVRSADVFPQPQPQPLPLPKQRLAECRQIRDAFTEEALEEHFTEATERGKELPTKALVKLAKQSRPIPAAAQPPALVAGTFSTIVADPPWRYGNTSTRGAAEDHYPTLSIDQLCGRELLPDGMKLTEDAVLPKVAERAHLYMWTTAGHLPDAFSVMEAWGFEYKTYLVWVKPQMGMGNYFRVSTELMLFGVRGGMRTQDMGLMNYLTAPRGQHSAKPQAFYDLIAKASPGPYLEMFARCYKDSQVTCMCSRCLRGWELWGNQA